MKEPDPPLPLRGNRTAPPVRDAAYTRSIVIAGVLIASLGCMAVSALLFSAWTLTDPEFSHGMSAPVAAPTTQPMHGATTQPYSPGKPGG